MRYLRSVYSAAAVADVPSPQQEQHTNSSLPARVAAVRSSLRADNTTGRWRRAQAGLEAACFSQP